MKLLLLFLAVAAANAGFSNTRLVDLARPLVTNIRMQSTRSMMTQKPLSAVLGFHHPQIDRFQREIHLNISSIIGDHLNDVLTQIQTVVEAAHQVAEHLATEFQALLHDLGGDADLWQLVQDVVSAMQEGLGSVFQDILAALGLTRRLSVPDIRAELRLRMEKGIADWWNNVLNWFSDAWQDIHNALGDAWSVVSQWASDGWNSVSETATSAWEWISDKWTDFSSWAGSVWSTAVDSSSSAIEQVQQLAQAFVNWASENLGSLSQDLVAQALAFFQAHKEEIGEFIWNQLLSLASTTIIGSIG